MNSNSPHKTLVWLTVNCSYSHSALALPLIHAACRRIDGWDWRRVEIIREEDSARIAADITRTPCDLLCATLYLFNRDKVMDILKRVHALSPATHIAVGGPECSGADAACFLTGHPFITSIFRGEGETVFPEFLRNFSSALRPSCYGPVVYSGWSGSPYPVNDVFFRTDKPFVQLETSRGCPMACAYCTSAGVPLRYRDLEQVREELTLLHARGVREIRVLDRTFNLPQARGVALLRLFGEFPDIHFHMEIHPQFLDAGLRHCFQQARPGQFHVEAGIQSLEPQVQQAIGRRSDIPAALDGLRFLASCSAFETHTDVLAGLPLQTLSGLRHDLTELMRVNPAEIQLEVLKILPGTPILHNLNNFNIAYSPAPPYDVMKTSTMSADDLLQARALSRLLDLFYNHPSMHPVMYRAEQRCPGSFLRLADRILADGMDLNTFPDLKKRCRYLAGFLSAESQAAALEELAFQWLMCGFPADDGPGTAAQIVRSVPPDAQFVEGDSSSADHRESKVRSLRRDGETWYLVFNRGYRINKPCALWKVPSSPSNPKKREDSLC